MEKVWALELGRPEFKPQGRLLGCFMALGKRSAAFFFFFFSKRPPMPGVIECMNT